MHGGRSALSAAEFTGSKPESVLPRFTVDGRKPRHIYRRALLGLVGRRGNSHPGTGKKMIHTIPIPKTAGRIGCAPGGDCCDDCRSHHLGDAASIMASNPNAVCDQDGNCYDTSTGELLESDVSSISAISPTTVLIGAGALLLVLFASSGKRR